MSGRMPCVWLLLTIVAAPRLSNAQERRLQEQNPASIPTALALALLEGAGYDSGRQPRVVVGRAPEGMLQSVMSFEGGTVIGGLTSDRSTIVVFAFTLPPNQVILSVDRQLRARGLRPPPPPPEVDRGGFVSSSFGYGGGGASGYCADSTGVAVASVPAPGGGTYLKVTQPRNQEYNLCTPRDMRWRIMAMPALKFPALLPPPGMSSMGGGGGSGGNSTSISAHLTGPLKPAELVAHYRTQLDAAGWRTRTPVTIGDDAAIAYVEASDSTRVVWHGLMTALQVSPSEVEVEIQMTKSREP